MKVLLAVDDSLYSTAAANSVATRPWPANTLVRVLTVTQNIPFLATELWYGAMPSLELTAREQQELRKNAEQLVANIAKMLSANGLMVETSVRTGDPHSIIVEVAKQWQADLIVVGSYGYSGLKRLLLGSVAHSVISNAPCSVEVVHKKLTDGLAAAG
jgi:nucleotide-binding universal stress UspA family protein